MCMDIDEFIKQHELPDEYADSAQRWFLPAFERIVSFSRCSALPVVIGINGSQGSGKSTLADLFARVLEQDHDLETVVLSIDDFYLTHNERKALSETVHPLLQTRGVPGTHDIAMMIDSLVSLKNFSGPVTMPRFDKSKDDRAPESQWDVVERPPDIIVLEGWCVGSDAQPEDALVIPLNKIEEKEDPDAIWRNHVNQQLQLNYLPLFSQVDIWIMLKAPSFDCVFDWRLEQEEKLSRAMPAPMSIQGKDFTGIMDKDDISRFIQHYQRITEYTLNTLPDKVNFLYELDERREIKKMSTPILLEK